MKQTHTLKHYPLGTELSMILLALLWFLPIYYLLMTTFKTPQEATLNPLGLPNTWIFENYSTAWQKMQYPHALFNTLFIAVLAVSGIVVFSSLAAYALARSKRRINSRMFLLFLAGLVVPFQMNIVSLYKIMIFLKLMNSPFAVILVNIALNLPQSIFLFREFISASVPREIEEAADIDGCSVPRKFFLIVFPLLKPVMATVTILTTLNVWNEFMSPLLFLQSRKNNVLLLEVYRNVGQFSTNWTMLFPMLLLAVLPLMLFYVLMQKYIIAGVAAGAVKG